MAPKPWAPPGWITYHEIAEANGLLHYRSLIDRLCRLPPALLTRRIGGRRCLRLRDLPELGRRIDGWLAGPKWTHFAPRKRRRRRRRRKQG